MNMDWRIASRVEFVEGRRAGDEAKVCNVVKKELEVKVIPGTPNNGTPYGNLPIPFPYL